MHNSLVLSTLQPEKRSAIEPLGFAIVTASTALSSTTPTSIAFRQCGIPISAATEKLDPAARPGVHSTGLFKFWINVLIFPGQNR